MSTLFLTITNQIFDCIDLPNGSMRPWLLLALNPRGHLHVLLIIWIGALANKITSYQHNC